MGIAALEIGNQVHVPHPIFIVIIIIIILVILMVVIAHISGTRDRLT
jgi:carbon starvation protein CstA